MCLKKYSYNETWSKAEQCYLCDAEDDVYGGGQGIDGAHQFTTHHLRKGQRHWLAQHHSFWLDSSNSWWRKAPQGEKRKLEDIFKEQRKILFISSLLWGEKHGCILQFMCNLTKMLTSGKNILKMVYPSQGCPGHWSWWCVNRFPPHCQGRWSHRWPGSRGTDTPDSLGGLHRRPEEPRSHS